MPQIKPYRTPWESAQALVAEHAFTKYGIVDADPLKVVTDLVFEPSVASVAEDGTVYWTGASPELRLAAAKTLLKYTRPEIRAVEIRVEGQIGVEHSHIAIDAVAKAKTLLTLIGGAKYTEGKLADEQAQLVQLPTDETQH